MKKLIIIPIILFFVSCRNNEKTIHFDVTEVDPEVAHNSANTFSKKVGDFLKANFPSRIKEVSAELIILNSNGANPNLYKIIWDAQIEPADSLDADYYFDRRGTLLPGATEEAAMEAVDREDIVSHKALLMTRQFDQMYGNHRMLHTSISIDYGNNPNGTKQYWCLYEHFCTARKIK